MNLKELAANEAIKYLQDGMVIGLGSGTTTTIFIDLLGGMIARKELKEIQIVPTSDSVANQAKYFGIPFTDLDKHEQLDLAVDGADEVDPELNLIKGLGKALLREKIIEIHTKKLIVIVDESKLVARLGNRVPLPVEILPFQYKAHLRWLNTLGCKAELWVESNGIPTVTENGNYLALCSFSEGIPDPFKLEEELDKRPGIIEHGLFLNMADIVLVAGGQGVKKMERIR